LFRFSVDDAGQHTFSIAQMGERMVPRDSGYQYSDGRLFLVQLADDRDPTNEVEIQYVKGAKGFHTRDIHLECTLEPGSYCLFTEVDWSPASKPADNSYCVTCYGASKVYLENDAEEFAREDVVRATMMSLIRNGVQGAAVSSLPEAPDLQVVEYKSEFNYNAYMINNGEKNQAYEEEADFPEFENVELLSPEKGNAFKIYVEPGEARMVLMKYACNGYNMSKSYSYKMIKNEQALYQECLEHGDVEERGAGISNYLLQHASGVFIVY